VGRSPQLELGNLRIQPYACTPSATRLLRQFWRLWGASIFHASYSEESAWRLAVVSPQVPDEEAYPPWLSELEREVCARFHSRWTTLYQLFSQAVLPTRTRGVGPGTRYLGVWPEVWPGSELGPDLCLDSETGQFFCLVDDDFDEQFAVSIFLHSVFLASWWHALRDGLCVHSSAVARGSDGFLFLGDSGAGKSTVARLSASAGYPVLGDDLNFIVRDNGTGYLLAAGPSARPFLGGYSASRPLLRGIFSLVQDSDEYVVSMSPKGVAYTLFQGLQGTPAARKLPDEAAARAFQTICDIARQVPGYELHFRKDHGFWNLIDEQFPS
jgi:hypothetical protein